MWPAREPRRCPPGIVRSPHDVGPAAKGKVAGPHLGALHGLVKAEDAGTGVRLLVAGPVHEMDERVAHRPVQMGNPARANVPPGAWWRKVLGRSKM